MGKKIVTKIKTQEPNNITNHNIAVNVTVPGGCCCCCDDPEIDILFELYALVATLPKKGPRSIAVYIDCIMDVVNVVEPLVIPVEVTYVPALFDQDVLIAELYQRLLKAWPAYIPIAIKLNPIFYEGVAFLGKISLKGYMKEEIIAGKIKIEKNNYCGVAFLGKISLKGYMKEEIIAGKIKIEKNNYCGVAFLGKISLKGYMKEEIIAGKIKIEKNNYCGVAFLGKISLKGYIKEEIIAGKITYYKSDIKKFQEPIGRIDISYSSYSMQTLNFNSRIGSFDIKYSINMDAKLCIYNYGKQADYGNSSNDKQFMRLPGNSWYISSDTNSSDPAQTWYNSSNKIKLFMICTPYLRDVDGSYASGTVYLAFQGVIGYKFKENNTNGITQAMGTIEIVVPLPMTHYNENNTRLEMYYAPFFPSDPNSASSGPLSWARNDTTYWAELYSKMNQYPSLISKNIRYSDYLERTGNSTATSLYDSDGIKFNYKTIRINYNLTSATDFVGNANVYFSAVRYAAKVEKDKQNYVIAQSNGLTSEGLTQVQAIKKYAVGDVLGATVEWNKISPILENLMGFNKSYSIIT